MTRRRRSPSRAARVERRRIERQNRTAESGRAVMRIPDHIRQLQHQRKDTER